jgi:hypothetical protein
MTFCIPPCPIQLSSNVYILLAAVYLLSETSTGHSTPATVSVVLTHHGLNAVHARPHRSEYIRKQLVPKKLILMHTYSTLNWY